MKFTRMEERSYEADKLLVFASVRYWEDATVNDIEDSDGELMPCIDGGLWCPIIDLGTGFIVNWTDGVKADIHYKVCDAGVYKLMDISGAVIAQKEWYVPDMLSPDGEGYGDYIIMKVDEHGKIENFKADLSYFLGDED